MGFHFYLLFLLAFSLSCTNETINPEGKKMILENSYYLSVPEPSGLCFSANLASLYTVSDESGSIYKLSMTGSILRTIDSKGIDLEGITINPKNGDFYIVEERSREVKHLDQSGSDLGKKSLNIPIGNENSGLEGICFNPANNHLFILNEKNPGLLIELDNSYNIVAQHELSFANDYSGIFYDENENLLWIVSDESKSIFTCTTNGTLLDSWAISSNKAEGIVVNSIEKKVYLVIDGINKLEVYSYDTH